ncbi:hypothetical protein ACFWYW_46840 [Nonomuraea sp. NPDC059023]|uniref:hypothetical protein n=1 Tax=unclassified Nonomuraea TaxID=2593643 RepID=UPI003679AF1F
MTEPDAAHQAAPTYYRHHNDDLKPEIVVRAWQPGHDTLWGFTVTCGTGFDPWVEVQMRTPHFAAYTQFPAFFQALADRKPTTLDDVARILDELGVADTTATREQHQAQTRTLLGPDDGWRYR